jgi:hypothetical protein
MQLAPNVPHDVPAHHVPSFDIDDAFSDGDADDITYQFSPEAIREDLGGKLDTGELEDLASNGFSVIQSSSFSTVDMNSLNDGEDEGPLRFASRSPPSTPDSQKSSGEFSQVSLSTTDKHLEQEDEEHTIDSPMDIPYPNIIIDASAGHLLVNRISLTSELNSSRETIEHGSFPSSQSPGHLPQTAGSTRSLPTPTLTSHRVRQDTQSNTATPTPVPSPSPSASKTDSTPLPSSSSAPPSSHIQPTPKPSAHRPTRSIGPSAFEKVRSKTRPIFLPPKPRQEDDKHMSDWKSMMEQSRVAGQGIQRAGKVSLLTSSNKQWKKDERLFMNAAWSAKSVSKSR